MTCRCPSMSPFLYAAHPRPSIFSSDGAFTPRSNGKTTSQTASEAVTAFMDRTGRSPGTMYGISAAADARSERTTYERRQRAPYARRAVGSAAPRKDQGGES